MQLIYIKGDLGNEYTIIDATTRQPIYNIASLELTVSVGGRQTGRISYSDGHVEAVELAQAPKDDTASFKLTVGEGPSAVSSATICWAELQRPGRTPVSACVAISKLEQEESSFDVLKMARKDVLNAVLNDTVDELASRQFEVRRKLASSVPTPPTTTSGRNPCAEIDLGDGKGIQSVSSDEAVSKFAEACQKMADHGPRRSAYIPSHGKVVDCTDCNGTGTIELFSSTETCTTCNGKGTLS